MRGVFSKHIPPLQSVLLIESGPREVAERLLRHLYEVQESRRVDIVTCYPGAPAGFNPEIGTCYSIHDPAYAGRRKTFIRMISGNQYQAVALLCTGSPVMNKWKWTLATKAAAKAMIVNENSDFFFLDWQHRHIAKMMVKSRMGLHGGVRLRLIGELLVVPFTVSYLLLYAGLVNLRRALR